MTPEPSDPVVQRRVAVGPVVAAVVALIVFAVIVTVVITLAASSSSPTATATPVAAPPSAPATSEETTAPTPESSVVPPSAESTGTHCVDYTRDVESLDIESARVEQFDRDDVGVEISLTAPLESETAQLGIYVERADGDRAYQFSVEIDEGEIEEVTAYEFGRGDDDDDDQLDSDNMELDGSTVRFTVPRSIGKKLGDEWSWFAFSASNDSTIDTCPGIPNAPEYLRFER